MNVVFKRKKLHYLGFVICFVIMVQFIIPNPLMLGTVSPNGFTTVEAQSGFEWIWDEYQGAPGALAYDDVLHPGWGATLGPYHNFQEINEHLTALTTAFSDYISVQTIGLSFQSRTIRCATVTAPGDSTGRLGILLVAHHHGREVITIENALYILDYLMANRADPHISYILQNFVIYLIPTLNPDSLFEVYVNPWHRKNLRPVDEDSDGLLDEEPAQDVNGNYWVEGNEGTGVYEGYDHDGDAITGEDLVGGVDLNRNYLVAWDDGINSAHSAAYHGTAPFSEPETQTMRNFVQPRASELVFAMSLHSGIECMFAPWFNNGSHTPHEALFAQVAVAIEDASGYERFDSGGTPGIWDDWMYGIMGIPAITLETFGRNSASIWDYFNPNADRVISYCERVWQAFRAMIEVLIDYHELPPPAPPIPPLDPLMLALIIGATLVVVITAVLLVRRIRRKRAQ